MHKYSVCVPFVAEAVQQGAGWPFGRRRGGITVTVWQSGPQPSCNGWALSRWTPLLPLFSPPHYLARSLFQQRRAMCGPLCSFSKLLWVNDGGLFSFSLSVFLQKYESVSKEWSKKIKHLRHRNPCNCSIMSCTLQLGSGSNNRAHFVDWMSVISESLADAALFKNGDIW